MSQLIKKDWSLPATSVRSEEAFSTAGSVLKNKQNKLLPEKVDRSVFCMILLCKMCTFFCLIFHNEIIYILYINIAINFVS